MPQLTLTVKRENCHSESKLSFQSGESLLLLCKKAGIEISSPCGGKGICGKCKVKFLSGAPLPKPSERSRLSAEELRSGYRLACMTSLTSDCEILLPEAVAPDAVGTQIDVFWEETELADRKKRYTDKLEADDFDGCCDNLIYELDEIDEEEYFVTADIGTTTIVMEKRRVRDGRVAAVYREVNAQKEYGADVLSRMEASVGGHKEELSELIRNQLTNGLHKLNAYKYEKHEQEDFQNNEPGNKQALVKASHIKFMVIAANTAMIHLLMGYDVRELSRAPFIPHTLDEIETEIEGVKTYIMPGISAFVGADLTAGMCAVDYKTKLTKQPGWLEQTGQKMKESHIEINYVNLLIDLGTNAEMILFDEKRAVCTSAAAGCAFDSIADAGLYGADVVGILARLLREEKIDSHGTLRDDLFDSGAVVEIEAEKYAAEEAIPEYPVVKPMKPAKMICITQEQIRQMQLAKAAVRCGIDYLTEQFGCRIEDISRVYLAGGFGYYLDADAAVAAGLLPEAFRDITYSCGNTALAGAAVYAKKKIEQDTRNVNYVNLEYATCADESPRTYQAFNLAEQPDFSERYISYLDFE